MLYISSHMIGHKGRIYERRGLEIICKDWCGVGWHQGTVRHCGGDMIQWVIMPGLGGYWLHTAALMGWKALEKGAHRTAQRRRTKLSH